MNHNNELICPKVLRSNYANLSKYKLSRRYQEMVSKEDLCLSVADTDFKIPKSLENDLLKKLQEGMFTYTYYDKEVLVAINSLFKKQYQLTFKPEEFILANGVMQLIQHVISTVTDEQDKIIIQPPVYAPFYSVIKHKNRQIVHNELVFDHHLNNYVIDFESLEHQMSDPKTKLMLLCHPHNPIGRIWTKEELLKIMQLSQKHDVYLCSDEIWHNIIFDNFQFTPFLSLIKNNKKNSKIIVLTSPAKDFNVGGAQIGYCFSYNQVLISEIRAVMLSNIEYTSTNCLSAELVISGYTNQSNQAWLSEYAKYSKKCCKYFQEKITKNTKIKMVTPQCLYLAWLDFKDLVKSETELEKRLNKIKIHGEMGTVFGENFPLHLRLMICLQPNQLDDLIGRLCQEFQ